MSHFNDKNQNRPPPVARKSSTNNLLSKFNPSNSTPGSSGPIPLSLGTSSVSVGNAMSFTSAGSGGTPTSATPVAREFDAQSMHSDNVGSSLSGAVSPQMGQGMSIEILRELVQKRILTLTYIRNIHEGCVLSSSIPGQYLMDCRQGHWFHTIQISKNELSMAFNNNDMKKRSVTDRHICNW